MTTAGQNIEVYIGDTANPVITVTDSDGVPVNLTGYVISYRARTYGADIVKTSTSGITVVDAVGGQFQINFLPSDTSTKKEQICKHECKIKLGATVWTVFVGELLLKGGLIATV